MSWSGRPGIRPRCGSAVRLVPSNEQRTAGQGNHKDYKPLRQGISACRDPDGLCLHVVAVRLTRTPLPYFSTGVSTSPTPEVRDCSLSSGVSDALAHKHALGG